MVHKRKDGSYAGIVCSQCGDDHGTTMLSKWTVDGCLQCGVTWIFCSYKCRSEHSSKHTPEDCKKYEKETQKRIARYAKA